MANLSTRVIYDPNEQALFDKANKDANLLLLDQTVKENTSACYSLPGSGPAISQMSRPFDGASLNFGQKADIENRVMNRTYELNNDRGRTNTEYMTNIGSTVGDCKTKETFVNENSRFTNPVVDYREMYTAPYAFTPYLSVNPQRVTAENSNFMTPNRYGESSRYSAKTAKYDLKPKQYATISQAIDYQSLVTGLVPKVQNGPITPPYA
jgi:hypothetical protein